MFDFVLKYGCYAMQMFLNRSSVHVSDALVLEGQNNSCMDGAVFLKGTFFRLCAAYLTSFYLY